MKREEGGKEREKAVREEEKRSEKEGEKRPDTQAGDDGGRHGKSTRRRRWKKVKKCTMRSRVVHQSVVFCGMLILFISLPLS